MVAIKKDPSEDSPLAVLQKKMLRAAAVVLLLVVLVASIHNKSTPSGKKKAPYHQKNGNIPENIDEEDAMVVNHQGVTITQKSRKRAPKSKVNKDGFHLCQINDPFPELGQPPPRLPIEVAPLPLRYVCAGPAYEEHGARIHTLLRRHKATLSKTFDITESQTGRDWGQRTLPIPSPSADNIHEKRTQILMVGGTHLQQVVAALTCQYAEHIDSIQTLHKTNEISETLLIRWHHNVDMYVAIHPPWMYTRHWRRLVERHIVHRPLTELDLIAVGKLNPYHPRQGPALLDFLMDHEGSHELVQEPLIFDKKTRGEEEDDMNDDEEDSDDDDDDPPLVAHEPPSFIDISDVYPGPMIYVSHFANYANRTIGHVQDSIQALKDGTPLPPTSRKYQQLQQKQYVIPNDLLKVKHHIGKQGGGTDLSAAAVDMFTTKAKPPSFSSHKKKNRFYNGRGRRLYETTSTTTSTILKKAGPPPADTKIRPQRHNLRAVHARKYVDALGECSTNDRLASAEVVTCVTDRQSKWYQNGHRCTGALGGHADLVAWDLIEAIYELLEHPSS